MASGKKSVLLYCDIIHTVKKLTDEQAGKLFKHYLSYINDENPKADDIVIDLVFEPIKQNLKRDLESWKSKKEGRSKAGKASAEARKAKKTNQQKATNSTSVKFVQQKSTNSTVNVNDNVNVSVNDNVNDILLEKETKELFNSWLIYRKEIKKPIYSDRTKKSLAKRIQKEGFEKSKLIINTSIENGWQGLFWDKFQEKKQFGVLDIDLAVNKKLEKYG